MSVPGSMFCNEPGLFLGFYSSEGFFRKFRKKFPKENKKNFRNAGGSKWNLEK